MSEHNISVHRYTDEQMAAIRDRVSRRDERWIDAVWDPIPRHVHGVALAEAGEQGLQIKVGDYGIP